MVQALLKCPVRSPFRRDRLPPAGAGSRGWSASWTRSVCVERTTIVSVRATPSIERSWLIRCSSDEVFAVFTFRSSVCCAGHVMALEHVVERRDLLLELGDPAGMADADADERGDVEAEAPRVEDGAVAGDHPGRLELLDALEHRGGREPHRLADAAQARLDSPPAGGPGCGGPCRPTGRLRCRRIS